MEEQRRWAPPAAATVACTFTEAGSLGIKLNPHKDTGRAIIVRVNPGSQGEKHPQLCAGLLIQQVGATDVSSMDCSEVLGVIEASKQRPLTVRFAKERARWSVVATKAVNNSSLTAAAEEKRRCFFTKRRCRCTKRRCRRTRTGGIITTISDNVFIAREKKVRGFRRPQFLKLLSACLLPIWDAWSDWMVVIEWYMDGDIGWFKAGLATNLIAGTISALMLIGLLVDRRQRCELFLPFVILSVIGLAPGLACCLVLCMEDVEFGPSLIGKFKLLELIFEALPQTMMQCVNHALPVAGS